jgi:hypothetical protein
VRLSSGSSPDGDDFAAGEEGQAEEGRPADDVRRGGRRVGAADRRDQRHGRVLRICWMVFPIWRAFLIFGPILPCETRAILASNC